MTSLRRIKILAMWATIALILCALQTAVWPSFLGSTAAPQLWLNMVLYFILFRTRMQALIIIYALGFIFTAFSSISLGAYWGSFLILIPIASEIREQAFWPSTRDFAIGSFGLTLGWQIVSTLISRYSEPNIGHISLFTKSIELALTTILAFPMYSIFIWFEKLVADESGPDISGATHE